MCRFIRKKYGQENLMFLSAAGKYLTGWATITFPPRRVYSTKVFVNVTGNEGTIIDFKPIKKEAILNES